MSTENILDLSKDGGVTKKTTKEGTGKKPSPLSKVKVHYVGHTSKGIVFDSSRDRNEPFEFVVGKGEVIKGWDLGIPTMKIGEMAVLTIKPEYGYGSQSMGEKLPANSTLVFEVELISFDDSKDWRYNNDQSLELKDKGNQEFQKNSYSKATSQYQKSLQLINEIPIEQLEEEEEKTKLIDLKKTLHLNLAMTLIMKKYDQQALDHCDQALKIEPNNVKGLYRKAICQGNLIKYDDAIKTLQAGLKFHPENEAMLEKLQFYKKKRDAYNKKHQNNTKKKNNNRRKNNNQRKNINKKKNNNKRNNKKKKK
ncbi:fk506-binding protein [Anaeramoeba flamelloides]|uniref:peptidylprolyl isomerase n=1 Tax=Anaeramoeba flamelloides TaxID=1746091 RepID=A0ABQ8Z8Q4_9EUKA|nr:fk506-binding protein [Anaeramoeba flamelloides]